MKNKNIIIFGSIDWNTNWQTQHRLVTSLLNNNNKVLFVENTGIRNAKLSDYQRLIDRIKFRKKSIKGFNFLENGANILSPILIPIPFSFFISKINKFLLYRILKQFIFHNKFNNPIIITFLPTPLIFQLIKKLKPQLVVYYCANEMQGMTIKKNNKLKSSEEKIIKFSDVIFCTSNNLFNKIYKINNNVYLFPAAVELNKFNPEKKFKIPEDLKKLKDKIVIGYVGAITQVIDLELLEKCITKFINYNFVFVGRIYCDVSKISILDNCYFLGEKKHTDIPCYVNNFDICLIPYKINNFTNSVYSCKTNEYLAMGKPVVATATKEIENIYKKDDKLLYISKNIEDYNSNIKIALNYNSEFLIQNRKKFAQLNSWESRFLEINNKLNFELDKTISKEKKYNYYSNYIKKFNKKLSIGLFVSFFIFFILFFSPFYQLSTKYFSVENVYFEKNNSVILLGYGSINYINQNYQDRTKEFINFYKQHNTINKIILTGRKQNYLETELVNGLLISANIPNDKIVVLREINKNTYEDIKNINKYLKLKKINNFVIFTSYFHFLRVQMIIKKNFPDLNVYYNQQKNYNSKTIKDKFNDYVVMFYEVFSILYNKIVGKI